MKLRLAIAQMKAISGDLCGNGDKILAYLAQAEAAKADLLVLPEACLVGYPLGDIANRPNFITATEHKVRDIVAATRGYNCAVLFGAVAASENRDAKVPIPLPYNSAILAHDGNIAATQYKAYLPNFDVFHEKRHFSAAPLPSPIEFRGIKLGLLICNDMWYPEPAEKLAKQGAEIFIVSNCSPYHARGQYHADKLTQRLNSAKQRIAEHHLPLVFVNAEGGQDDLLFDGQSFIVNSDAEIAVRLPAFDNRIHISEWQKNKNKWTCTQRTYTQGEKTQERSHLSVLYQALVVGLRDYMEKNNFKAALLGLSGGVDSAVAACLAVDALGAENVLALRMPSRYNSEHSLNDASLLAENLGIACETISIEATRGHFMQLMEGYGSDIAAQNIQARIRSNILMFIANTSGRLLLSPGNKSEIAMGYATLYGDMCGGFAPIKDVYKTSVFALAEWRNKHSETYMRGPARKNIIPENIITKAPSAELKPEQKDEDTLPPYDILDAMLEFLIENNGDWSTLKTEPPFTKADTHALWSRIVAAEHKRAQGAVGTRVSPKGFGSGWHYPITHAYKEENL